MPTLFVGVHLALVGVIALLGLTFLANPCVGDLCLGGVVALFAFGVAGLGVLGAGIWRVWRRASPLLVWDCALLAFAGSLLASIYPFGPAPTRVGAETVLFLALPGAALAGMAVVRHRIERLVAIAAFIGLAVFDRGYGVMMLGWGLVALATGWLLPRLSSTKIDGPGARPPGEDARISPPAGP